MVYFFRGGECVHLYLQKFRLQSIGAFFLLACILFDPDNGIGHFRLLCGQQRGDGPDGILFFGIVGQSTAATENIDAGTAPVALYIYNFDETDLSGGIYMWSTAGTQIHAGDLDNTYIFRECQFAAVI